MYKALNYVIRHYEELTAYLDIPEMPLGWTNKVEIEDGVKKLFKWYRQSLL